MSMEAAVVHPQEPHRARKGEWMTPILSLSETFLVWRYAAHL
jgi:hypothetical protein